MAENGNGKQITAWITIAVTIMVVFATQAINADVRNRERDEAQDVKINTTEADVREIKVKLAYIEDTLGEQKTDIKEILRAVKR